MSFGTTLAQDPASGPTMRIGVVTQASPLLVRVGAATTPAPASALGSYAPRVDDVVTLLEQGADRVVLGVASGEVLDYADWTPVVQQGVIVGAAVIHADRCVIGRTVHASFRLQITGNGLAGEAVGVSLPINAARTIGNVGFGGIFHLSAGQVWTGIADLNSVNSQMVFTGTGLGIGPAALGDAHFTAALAPGDIVTANLTYRRSA
jgi:hypothetical protein